MGDLVVFFEIFSLGYLLGSIPFGFIFARWRKVDITHIGSGNTGATNVLRALGPKYAVPVLILDMGKGALAAYLGLRYLGMGNVGAVLAGAAAIAGHNWSLFLKFRGGKGVATTAGAAAIVFPWLLLAAVAVFIFTVIMTKYVSLGSILGVWAAFLLSLLPSQPLLNKITIFLLGCAITYTHRQNIQRLLKGTENRFGAK